MLQNIRSICLRRAINTVLCVCLFSSIGIGQEEDNARIDSLLRAGRDQYKTDLDSALVISKEAHLLAVSIHDTSAIAKTIVHSSFYLMAKKEFQEAEQLLQFNLDNRQKLSDNIIGDTYNNLGSIYSINQDRDKAIAHYFSAIDAYEAANDNGGLAKVYLNIGLIYSKLEKTEFSDYFFEKSKYHSSIDSRSSSVHDLSKTESFRDFESQLKISTSALSTIEDQDNSRLAGMLYHGMSNLYLTEGLYAEAITAAKRSIAIKKNINFEGSLGLAYYYMGFSQIKLGLTDDGIGSLNQAAELSSGKNVRASIYEMLIDEYQKKGNYKRAFEISGDFRVLNDSINRLQENERIAEITAQFETEKQAAEIEILETDNELKETKIGNQRNIIWASAIGGLLLLISLFFAYQNHKTRQNLRLSELTQKLLQMQLNPHFLFNALNGIQFFIKKNDVKKSTKYINSFSGLMRNILENSVEKFISVEEDYKTIEDFLALQQLVHNEAFQYTVTIDETIDKENTGIPPMFTQPFVENAIIHGVKNISDGHIEVKYQQEGDIISVLIKDNGKGIHSDKSNSNSLHKSMGTSITKQRMENLLKSEKFPIELEITSRNDESGEQGTKIVLSFPLKYI